MQTSVIRHALGGLAVAVALTGCQQPVDLSKIEEGIAKLEKKQDKILARLDEVEKKAGAGSARPAPRRPNRPDPNKVHKVDLGDAHWKGAKDAKVTIVEWSEFQ